MLTRSLIVAAIVPIFLAIVAGFVARRLGWLTEEADRSLMRVTVNLFYPCLILDFVLGNDALRVPSNLILPPLLGLTSVLGGFGVAMVVARLFKIGDQKECRTFAFATGIQNYGYFALPIAALLFDRETTGVLIIYNLGVEIAMWTLGVGYILATNDPKSIWRRVFSGPVIAILIAVPVNLLGWSQSLPNGVYDAISLLGQVAIPLALVLIGATFSDLSKGVSFTTHLQIPLFAILLRIGLYPAVLLFIAFLFPFPTELKAVVAIQAAMPCGVFPIVLARYFDGSPEVAFKVVFSTTIVGILTIPIWIGFGVRILGL